MKLRRKRNIVNSIVGPMLLVVASSIPTLSGATTYNYVVVAGGPAVTLSNMQWIWPCYAGLDGDQPDVVTNTVNFPTAPVGELSGTVTPNPGIANSSVETITVQAAANASAGTYGMYVSGVGTNDYYPYCGSYDFPPASTPITITVQEGVPNRYSPQQKADFTKAAADKDQLALAISTAGLGCSRVPLYGAACSGLAGIEAALVKWQSSYLKSLAQDPPDPDYTQVSPAVASPFVPIVADGSNDQASVNAMNAWMANQAQQTGLMQAIETAINRSSTAYTAGDTNTSNMQLMVASQFNSELSILVAAEPALVTNLTTAMTNDAFPITNVTAAQEASFQQSVVANGLPAGFVAAATALGATSADLAQWTTDFTTATTHNLVGLTGVFTTTALATDSSAVSSDTYAMASNNELVPLQIGHYISGTGNYKESSGTLVGFKMYDTCSKYTSKCTGQFTLTDSTVSPAVSLSKLPVANASTMNSTYAIIDGTYTDTSGNPQSFVEVAYTPTGGSKLNHIAIGLSTGYASNGQKTVGAVIIK